MQVSIAMSIWLALALSASVPCASFAQEERQSVLALEDDEAQGLNYYSRARFEDAYPLIWSAARRGLKKAQYTLGLMYVKGEFVEQDLVKGAAWLGVSTETRIEEWVDTFHTITSALDETQGTAAREKLGKYIEYYGMEVQGISCRPAPRRQAEVDCTKASGEYPLHDYQ